MNTPRNAPAPQPLAWSQMRRSDFDAAKPLTLFDIERDATEPVKADPFGTSDLFGWVGMEDEMNALTGLAAGARAKVDVTDIAHVADALNEITQDSYDDAADHAATLLDRFPARLTAAVENWEADRITWKAFVAEIRACL